MESPPAVVDATNGFSGGDCSSSSERRSRRPDHDGDWDWGFGRPGEERVDNILTPTGNCWQFRISTRLRIRVQSRRRRRPDDRSLKRKELFWWQSWHKGGEIRAPSPILRYSRRTNVAEQLLRAFSRSRHWNQIIASLYFEEKSCIRIWCHNHRSLSFSINASTISFRFVAYVILS